MDSFNPTTKTQAALTAALQAASSAGNPQIVPAHLLMALLTQNDGIAVPLLEAVGVEPGAIRAETQRLLDRLPSASGASAQPQLSRESLAAITTAQNLATEMDDEYVSTEHLMAGCVQNGPLTPYQQEYYKKQQEYQTLGDNRRQDRPCPPNNCK